MPLEFRQYIKLPNKFNTLPNYIKHINKARGMLLKFAMEAHSLAKSSSNYKRSNSKHSNYKHSNSKHSDFKSYSNYRDDQNSKANKNDYQKQSNDKSKYHSN